MVEFVISVISEIVASVKLTDFASENYALQFKKARHKQQKAFL